MHVNYEQFDDYGSDGMQPWMRRKPPRHKRQHGSSYNSRRMPPRYTQWSVEDWQDIDANDVTD